jgi:hypothetical protein
MSSRPSSRSAFWQGSSQNLAKGAGPVSDCEHNGEKLSRQPVEIDGPPHQKWAAWIGGDAAGLPGLIYTP